MSVASQNEKKTKSVRLDRIVCYLQIYIYYYNICQPKCNINKDRKLIAFKQTTVNRANPNEKKQQQKNTHTMNQKH